MTDQPYQPQQPSQQEVQGPDPKRDVLVNLGANMMKTGFQQIAATSRNPLFAAAVAQQGEDIANAMRESWHAKEYEEFQNTTGQQFQQSMGTMASKFDEAISPIEGVTLQPKKQLDKDGVVTGQMEGYSEVPTVGLPTGRYNKEGLPLVVPLSDPRSRVILSRANSEMVKGLSGLTQRYIQAAQQYRHNPAIVNQVAGLIKVQYDWINQLTSGVDYANQQQAEQERMDMDRTNFQNQQEMYPIDKRTAIAKAAEAEEMPALRRSQTAANYASASADRAGGSAGNNKLLRKIFSGETVEGWWYNLDKELGTELDNSADMYFSSSNEAAAVEMEIKKRLATEGLDPDKADITDAEKAKIERIRAQLTGARTAEMKFRARVFRLVGMFAEASGGNEAEATEYILNRMENSKDKVIRKAAQTYGEEIRELKAEAQPTAPVPQ